MPEYLAPGVFIEEVSFRAKSIEGVPTSTTGFAGIAPFGPVRYPGGPTMTEPRLVTSFPEFERAFGKLDPINVAGGGQRLPFLAHAARVFFLNGGHRLYISRVFVPVAGDLAHGVASATFAVPTATASTATWRARWPGTMGNVAVTTVVTRSRDVANHTGVAPFANSAKDGTIVEVVSGAALPAVTAPPNADQLRVVRVGADGTQSFEKADGNTLAPAVSDLLSIIELSVLVGVDGDRSDGAARMGTDPNHNRFIQRILDKEHPEDEDAVLWLDYNFATVAGAHAIPLLLGLVGTGAPGITVRLEHGNDGALPGAIDFLGVAADPDDITKTATGLEALGDIDDIAIEAVPDAGGLDDAEQRFATASNLVGHCERSRYRIAIVDGPRGASINDIRHFRGRFDSTYGAIYHPWVEILDPNQSATKGAPPQKLLIPPSGFVAGIYGRTDTERGVFKAPANEVVYGLTRFEVNINQGRDEVLNPEGINALRYFPGRSYRVWGARTLTSDPEWTYVNVRRLFIFLEHSIYKATQWAVFEPNNESLWRNVAQSVKDFLEVQWRAGALLGSTPDQAYFVRCDRTTMTQNDLDNGRLICLVGVAPTRPAEFVIFRIGQWTADAHL